MAAVADEEYASLGAEVLAQRWVADEAVIPEPTGMAVGIAHKGFSCVEVTHGRAAHGSRPADGMDAICLMGRVLARLEALDRELQSRPPHPRLGTGSLHAGRIVGGTELSIYPARAVLAGRAAHAAWRACRHRRSGRSPRSSSELATTDPAFRADVRLLLARPAYETPRDATVISHLAAAARARLGEARLEGMSFLDRRRACSAPRVFRRCSSARAARDCIRIEEHVVVDDLSACADVLRAWLEG